MSGVGWKGFEVGSLCSGRFSAMLFYNQISISPSSKIQAYFLHSWVEQPKHYDEQLCRCINLCKICSHLKWAWVRNVFLACRYNILPPDIVNLCSAVPQELSWAHMARAEDTVGCSSSTTAGSGSTWLMYHTFILLWLLIMSKICHVFPIQ